MKTLATSQLSRTKNVKGTVKEKLSKVFWTAIGWCSGDVIKTTIQGLYVIILSIISIKNEK